MEIIYIVLIIILVIALLLLTFMIRLQSKKASVSVDELRKLNKELTNMRVCNDMLGDKFKVIAADSLDRNANYLRQTATDEFEKLISPLKMRIEDFNNTMQKSYTDANASRKSLSDQIENLTRLNQSIGEDARNLASALKGNNRIQGKWGETVLEKLLENSGLLRGVNFETQVTQNSDGSSLRSEAGALLRPDMIIHLPQNRDIIVDAKTSLSSYIDYCQAEESGIRHESLKKHLLSIRRHIDELSSKNYSKTICNSMEQVLMFVPNDGALILAIDSDPEIIHYASKRKITLVSPSQLSGILMIVNQLWRKENQDRNAAEIARLGGLLYDSVSTFLKEMQSVQDHLNKATDSYVSAYTKLVTGPRSIAARAEKLKNLGAKTTKNIPPDIIQNEMN